MSRHEKFQLHKKEAFPEVFRTPLQTALARMRTCANPKQIPEEKLFHDWLNLTKVYSEHAKTKVKKYKSRLCYQGKKMSIGNEEFVRIFQLFES